MGFMDRARNGWALLLASFGLIRQHKKLLLFPMATAFFTLIIGAFFLAPVLTQWRVFAAEVTAEGGPTPVISGFFILAYFLSMFLATYFNVAFYHEILNALKGDPVSIREGLAFAGTRLKAILVWSLFAGAIGLAIRRLEERQGLIGRWIVGLIGIAWSVASAFAIPIIVRDEDAADPLTILRRSGEVIKSCWGEGLAGYAGLQMGSIVGLFMTLALLGGGALLSMQFRDWWIMGGAVAVWFPLMIAFSYVMSVAGEVYRCVLFAYARERMLPDGFTEDMMKIGWTRKG